MRAPNLGVALPKCFSATFLRVLHCVRLPNGVRCVSPQDLHPNYSGSGPPERLSDITELKKLTKSSFNLEDMLSAASDLKYSKEIKQLLAKQLTEPSEDFVRFFAAEVHPGRRVTQNVLKTFEELVARALREFISDRVNERLKSALSQVKEEQETEMVQEPAARGDVETTEAELAGFRIVQSIVRDTVAADRVVMRDAKSYCSVLLDDNNRKPICRLRFNNLERLVIGVFDEAKNEERHRLETVDGIFQHADRLKATVGRYLKRDSGAFPTQAESE